MNKSYFVSLVVLLFFCMHVQGQEKSILSAYYTLEENGQAPEDWYRYMLDIGENTSCFSDYYAYENKLMNDSICKARGIKPDADSYTIYIWQKGFHTRFSQLHVLKNTKDASLILADKVIGQANSKFYYEEPLSDYGWEMLGGDTIIGGYACQKAQMYYRGHTWMAWYAPEIAISDGPWKLCGLPGLIMDAYDSEGEFHFVLTALQSNTQRDVSFSTKKWKKTTAEKLYKMYLQKQKSEMAGLARAMDGMVAGGKMEAPPYHYLERFDK